MFMRFIVVPKFVTDFVSFYTLPSTVMNHPVHKSLKAAYSFYNVSTATRLIELMNDALISAKNVRNLLVGKNAMNEFKLDQTFVFEKDVK